MSKVGSGVKKKQSSSKTTRKAYLSPIHSKIAPLDNVTASINTSRCINCGVCRETCPVDAISESQRIICHVCPSCTQKPGMSPQAMDALATSQSCTTACPLNISPQGYVGLVKHEKYEEAFQLIWEKNPLPSVCGSICHRPCEDACKRGICVDSSIKIRAIKKFLSAEVDVPVKKYPVLYDEQVAVIGAGPAGLATAHFLSLCGYEVTVFESSAEAGGMLMRGIPRFRLDRSTIDRDIGKLCQAGLDIRLNNRVDRRMIEKLKDEYDVIVIATGAPDSKELGIPGHYLAGVMGAVSFMDQVNNGMEIRRHLGQLFEYKGGEAVIIGGGSVAMDVARTAVRVGASKVTVVCLETGEDIPAQKWEIEEAKEEGVVIVEGYSPIEYQATLFPELQGVKFAKVSKFSKDESGKINFKTNNKDTMELKADWVVEAVGQVSSACWSELDEEGIFFAGDISSKELSVVDAMASGRKTAIAVDAALRGRAAKVSLEKHTLNIAPIMEKIYPHNLRKIVRPATPMLCVSERKDGFDEIEGVLSAAEVKNEAISCLACGYHEVDQKECIACGICQKQCPKGDVITMVIKEGGNE